jgi:hypothetical protein
VIMANSQIINKGYAEPKISEKQRDPFIIAGTQAKVIWLLISAVVSFLANIATVYVAFNDFINNKPTLPLILIFLPCLCCVTFFCFYLLLKKNRILKLGPVTIANHDGKLFLVKYDGVCPICGGKLKFTTDYQQGQSISRCMANDSHLFPFSTKIFDKSNYA